MNKFERNDKVTVTLKDGSKRNGTIGDQIGIGYFVHFENGDRLWFEYLAISEEEKGTSPMKNFNPDTATNVFAAMRVLFLQEGGDNFTPLDVQEFLQDVMFVKMTTGEISDYMQGFTEGSITVIMAVPSEETAPVVDFTSEMVLSIPLND